MCNFYSGVKSTCLRYWFANGSAHAGLFFLLATPLRICRTFCVCSEHQKLDVMMSRWVGGASHRRRYQFAQAGYNRLHFTTAFITLPKVYLQICIYTYTYIYMHAYSFQNRVCTWQNYLQNNIHLEICLYVKDEQKGVYLEILYGIRHSCIQLFLVFQIFPLLVPQLHYSIYI